MHTSAAPGNPYSELDKEAQNAVDTSSATLLFEDIYSRTLGGALPPSLMQRMVRAHLAFLQQKHGPVHETDVASAINRIGTGVDVALGTRRFTGTNATQVGLVRAAFYGELPHLLAFPSQLSNQPRQAELSPAGAVYMTFLLLRQKLTNPAWYGDPDQQNAFWVSGQKWVSQNKPGFSAEDPAVTQVFKFMASGAVSDAGPFAVLVNAALNDLGL